MNSGRESVLLARRAVVLAVALVGASAGFGYTAATGFDWWLQRFGTAARQFDIVRIDHFRGFAACWEVPGRDDTAVHGRWVAAPGRARRSAEGPLRAHPRTNRAPGLFTPRR